jgi:hypothetical protein
MREREKRKQRKMQGTEKRKKRKRDEALESGREEKKGRPMLGR